MLRTEIGPMALAIFRESAGVAAFTTGNAMVNVFLKSEIGFGRLYVTVFLVIVTLWAKASVENTAINAAANNTLVLIAFCKIHIWRTEDTS